MAWHLQSGARGTAGQTLESWRDWEQQEDALLGLQAGWGVAAPPHPAQAASGVSAPWCSCLARHRTAAPSLPGPGGYLLHHAPLSIRSHLFLPNCCFIPPLLCFACRGTYIWSGCQGRGRKFIWENRRTWLFPNLQDTSTTGMQGARTGRTQRAQQAAWGVQPELRARCSGGIGEGPMLCCSQPAKQRLAKSHIQQQAPPTVHLPALERLSHHTRKVHFVHHLLDISNTERRVGVVSSRVGTWIGGLKDLFSGAILSELLGKFNACPSPSPRPPGLRPLFAR